MKELIKITEKDGSNVVSARELHEYLESKQRFTDWVKARVDKYEFVDGVDFTLHKIMIGRNRVHEYALTIDTAKEIAMVEGNNKGKQARRYFIECERKLKRNKPVAIDFSDPDTVLMLAQNWKKEKDLRIKAEEVIQIQAPKAEYHDKVLTSTTAHPITYIAKELGMSAIALNKKLNELEIQYKQSGSWFLYSKYQNQDLTKTSTHTRLNSEGETVTSLSTKWTEKGRKFIHELYNEGELN